MTYNCPHCAAPMNLTGVTQRQRECEYCHQVSVLPDHVWQAVKPKPQTVPHHVVHQQAMDLQRQQFKHGRSMARGAWVISLLMTAGILGFVYFMQRKVQQDVNRNIRTATGSTRSSGSSGGSRGGSSGDRKPVTIATVKLTFKSDPTGAAIYIDGKKLEDVETPATVDQRKTSDVILVKLVKEGYVPVVKKITPDADQTIELTLSK